MPFKKADVVRLQQLSLSLIPNLCVLETFLATKQSDGFVMLLALALKNEGYADQGEITVISDGAECLKRLAGMLPQPVTHILDWFHISMKIQPLALLAVTAPKHLSNFGNRIERIKWRLWSEQAGRAHSLIARARRDLSGDTVPSIWAHRADQLLETLQIYIRRNKSSVANYAERYRAGKRIATAPAEASVNRLVAKRFVKRQQMRWSRTGAHYLLKVRASVLNGDLAERTKYEAPKPPVPGNIAAFVSPTPPLLKQPDPTILNGPLSRTAAILQLSAKRQLVCDRFERSVDIIAYGIPSPALSVPERATERDGSM